MKNRKLEPLRILLILSLAMALLALSSCGFLKKDECEHEYTESVEYPDCTSNGTKTFTCTNCGESYTESVSPKGHSYTESIIAATCGKGGYTVFTCSACSESYNSDFTAALSHHFVNSSCVNCSSPAPSEAIEPSTEWYSEDITVFSLSTKEELAGLASLVNSGTTFANKTVHIKQNIDLGFMEWTPIGNSEYAFAGTFDGDGNTISGLKISVASNYAGLFGNVSGTIGSFKIEDATLYSEDYFEYVGIACGYSSTNIADVTVDGYLDVRECKYVGSVAGYTKGQISASSSSAAVTGGSYVGGIAGYASPASAVFAGLDNFGAVTGGDYTGGIVGSVTSSGIVLCDTIKNEANVSGKAYTGGIFGHIKGSDGSNIKASSSAGIVTGEYYVGGLIGKAEGTSITDCSNAGSEISASSCLISGTDFFAYLGGYVGYGTSVSGCVNNSNINYISRGRYVGGIAGYLTAAASSCENHGTVSSGADYVGGIVGSLVSSANLSLTSLKNTASITGTYRTGGIIGYASSTGTFLMSNIENSGAVTGGGDLGGIAGCVNYGITPGAVTASDLSNTGDVIGTANTVGGLFGYIGGNSSSVIKSSSSSAKIQGSFKVGGLVGDANVSLKDSTNEGSTITATGYVIDGEKTYAYLGGYVGTAGAAISGCINKADITYTSVGAFVGGIAGRAAGTVSDCENHGNISSTSGNVGGIVGKATNTVSACENHGNITSGANNVGGIAGYLDTSLNYGLTYYDLINTGNINGSNYIGGIAGIFVQEISVGTTAVCNSSVKDPTKEKYVKTNIDKMFNSGNVSGDSYIGGLFGSLAFNNSYYRWDTATWYWGKEHAHTGYSIVIAKNFENRGVISGKGYVGELFGKFSSDDSSAVKSTLTAYTVIGSIIWNDELKEGTWDIGDNKNLTLSERTVYTPPVEEPENSEDTTTEGTESTGENTNPEGSENNGEV